MNLPDPESQRPFFNPNLIPADEDDNFPQAQPTSSGPPKSNRKPPARGRKKNQKSLSQPADTLFSTSQPETSSPATLTVSELTAIVKNAIQTSLPAQVYVVGELSNVSRPSGGHVYFTLKDANSEIRCVMWRSSAQTLKFDMSDGLEVIATGNVDVFEPRGQYQLYVRRLEPRGVGALELAFRQLKERLGREGLFDPARKRPLPRFPRRIAVVTSMTGAAVRDILQTLERRYRCVEVLVYGVRVQGEGAAVEIAEMIDRINRTAASLDGIDVMIVGRGGGSLEDLWAFNEEIVARAIHASLIPIISAVGHEVDFTIADFVADVRAATPTAAAELVVPLLDDLLLDIDAHRQRMVHGVRRRMEASRSRVKLIERSAWFRDPVGQIQRKAQRVDELFVRLRYGLSRALERRRTRLQAAEMQLMRVRPAVQLARRNERLMKMTHRLQQALRELLNRRQRRLETTAGRLFSTSPRWRGRTNRVLLTQLVQRLRRGIEQTSKEKQRQVATLESRLTASSYTQVLHRGFTITRRARDGSVIHRASDVRAGDQLLTQTAEGQIESRVVDENENP